MTSKRTAASKRAALPRTTNYFITQHGKREGALLSASKLCRYRELDRLMEQLLDVLAQRTHLEPAIANGQIAAIVEQVQSVNEHTKKQ